MESFETVIGLEVHVELSTKTKIFCGCSTAFGGRPNSQVCPVCMGMPGTLPILNRQVLEDAIAVGLVLGCEIRRESRFDRKNYFYPDNPQNYQISQLYQPIGQNGEVCLEGKDIGKKRVRIHEIHMEEDAGKLIHDETGRRSFIDYNRAGVPLIEIVTEPDLSGSEEVIAFLEKLRESLQYLGVSDCKLQEGSIRADVNLSLRRVGETHLGTRTEMKNLNSYHAIADAIAAERERQQEILKSGGIVIQETRRWDEDRKQSFSMRSKEDTKDYRYFPDPDIPVLRISEEWIGRICESLPEMRGEKKKRFQAEYGLLDYDAELISESPYVAELFEKTVSLGAGAKKAANWLMGEGFRICRERGLDPEEMALTPEHFAGLLRLVEDKVISQTVAKELFESMVLEDADPERLVAERRLATVSDEGHLKKVTREIIEQNPKSVQDYLGGKEKAIGYLVGQTMKAMKGQADPTVVTRLLQEELSKLR